jgi:hypothetical protein
LRRDPRVARFPVVGNRRCSPITERVNVSSLLAVLPCQVLHPELLRSFFFKRFGI